MVAPLLPSEVCAYLLALPNADLQQWLQGLPLEHRAAFVEQLCAYRTPQELAELSLYEFVKQAWHVVEPDRPFIPGWHLEAICQHFEALNTRVIRNLLINVPPAHCKSRISNVFFPAWVFIRNPSARFFHASYAQELATRDSIDCRYIIESEWYRRRWGDRVRLVGDQNQKIKFATTEHGWRLATSVGGRGTGEHPDFIIVDDPHSVSQAESQLERESCLRWWESTISSRGAIREVRKAVIMQRLNVNDLSGFILDRGGFDHICLPYRYEPDRMSPTTLGWTDPRTTYGELLWPGVPEQMKQTFANLSPRVDAGQLQQRPVPAGGSMFHKDWFATVNELPREATQAVRYWDKAASEGQGDYTVGVLVVHCHERWYVADVVRGRWSIHHRNRVILETARRDVRRFPQLITVVEQEGGSGGKESAQYTVRQLAGFDVRTDRVTGSKEFRAQPFADQCEAGHVDLVKGQWNAPFLDELCVFPHGLHDDQVDSVAGAFHWCLRVPNYEPPSSAATPFDPGRHGVQLVGWREARWRRN